MRLADTAVFGRTWINTVAKDDETIRHLSEVTRFFFFNYTGVRTSKVVMDNEGMERNTGAENVYLIHAPMYTLIETFGMDSTKTYRRGEPIARGLIIRGTTFSWTS